MASDLRKGLYVFTPINETTLVRARILNFDNEKEIALVRFIDNGDVAWRDKSALFEMDFEKRQFPWQAIPIVLQGAEPQNEVSFFV